MAVRLSTIPAAKALLVFAGLESLLSIDHWHLPTAALRGLDELPTFVKDICPSPCVAFSLLVLCSKVRTACKSA